MSRNLLCATLLLLAACQHRGLSSTGSPSGGGVVADPIGWMGSIASSGSPSARTPPEGIRLHGQAVGLEGKGLLLRLSSEELAVDTDGEFMFSTMLPIYSSYRVAIVSEPDRQHCTVTHGSGVIDRTRPDPVVVTCHRADATYHVGGTVSGLTGTLTLTNLATGESLPVAANGAFAFGQTLRSRASYDVRIVSQPQGEHCVVAQGADVVFASDVTSVQVSCVAAQCVNLGWKTGKASFDCPDGYRMPTAADDALVAPCVDPADRGRFGSHADVAATVGGCGCAWNGTFCEEPSIQTMHAGTACGDYAQLHVCVAQ